MSHFTLSLISVKEKANVMEKIHNLRHRIVPLYGDKLYSERNSALKLRLRESQLIFAEFMDFSSIFVFFVFCRVGNCNIYKAL